jgi:hypothetical protein
MANTATSTWVSTVPIGETGIAGGQYIFETSFDLTGFDEDAVTIFGKFAADNSVDEVYLNGNLVAGVSGGGFTFWTPFTLDDGLQAGVNTLTFLFTNAPGAPPADNPGGFRLEMNGFAVVPEPSSVMLGLVGALGLGLIARRRSK